MFKIKENKGLRGDVLEYVAQAIPQFDIEIGQRDHFRMETSLKKAYRGDKELGIPNQSELSRIPFLYLDDGFAVLFHNSLSLSSHHLFLTSSGPPHRSNFLGDREIARSKKRKRRPQIRTTTERWFEWKERKKNGRQSSRGYGSRRTRDDQIAGVLVNKEPRNEAAGASARYYIENQDGMFLVWGSAVIDDLMQHIKIGQKIRITFDGRTTNKKNQYVNQLKVEVAKNFTQNEEMAPSLFPISSISAS